MTDYSLVVLHLIKEKIKVSLAVEMIQMLMHDLRPLCILVQVIQPQLHSFIVAK